LFWCSKITSSIMASRCAVVALLRPTCTRRGFLHVFGCPFKYSNSCQTRTRQKTFAVTLSTCRSLRFNVANRVS
jgi:hypothetical protein